MADELAEFKAKNLEKMRVLTLKYTFSTLFVIFMG